MRIEDRFDTDIDDLWSALTDPGRLARWLGEVEGDLRPGGEFRVYIEADGMRHRARGSVRAAAAAAGDDQGNGRVLPEGSGRAAVRGEPSRPR